MKHLALLLVPTHHELKRVQRHYQLCVWRHGEGGGISPQGKVTEGAVLDFDGFCGGPNGAAFQERNLEIGWQGQQRKV
eukprot:5516932-Ditylum_brightwellii.AAC.1